MKNPRKITKRQLIPLGQSPGVRQKKQRPPQRWLRAVKNQQKLHSKRVEKMGKSLQDQEAGQVIVRVIPPILRQVTHLPVTAPEAGRKIVENEKLHSKRVEKMKNYTRSERRRCENYTRNECKRVASCLYGSLFLNFFVFFHFVYFVPKCHPSLFF